MSISKLTKTGCFLGIFIIFTILLTNSGYSATYEHFVNAFDDTDNKFNSETNAYAIDGSTADSADPTSDGSHYWWNTTTVSSPGTINTVYLSVKMAITGSSNDDYWIFEYGTASTPGDCTTVGGWTNITAQITSAKSDAYYNVTDGGVDWTDLDNICFNARYERSTGDDNIETQIDAFWVKIDYTPPPGSLNVSLMNPTLGLSEINKTGTFNVSANISCGGGPCTGVNGTIFYNLTGLNPNTELNGSIGHKPFYNFTNPVNYSCGDMSGGDTCYVSWLVNATGDVNTDWALNVTTRSSDANVLANYTSPSFVVKIRDTVFPQLTINNPSANEVFGVNDLIDVTITPTDPGIGIDGIDYAHFRFHNLSHGNRTPWVQLSPTEEAEGGYNLTFNWTEKYPNLQNGYYNITFNVSDYAGNENLTKNVTIKLVRPPQWLNRVKNATEIPKGGDIELSAEFKDWYNLSMCYLATNESEKGGAEVWNNFSIETQIKKDYQDEAGGKGSDLAWWEENSMFPRPSDMYGTKFDIQRYINVSSSDDNLYANNSASNPGLYGVQRYAFLINETQADSNRSKINYLYIRWIGAGWAGGGIDPTRLFMRDQVAGVWTELDAAAQSLDPRTVLEVTFSETQNASALQRYINGSGYVEVKVYSPTAMGTGWIATDYIYMDYERGQHYFSPLHGNESKDVWYNISFVWSNSSVAEGSTVGYIIGCFDDAGNWNQTTIDTFDITAAVPENTAPTIAIPSIIPSSPQANDSMNCSALPTDDENSTLYVNFTWYKNLVIDDTYNYLQTCADGTPCYTGTLVPASVIASGENWTCAVKAWDDVPPEGLNSTKKNISIIVQNITTNNLTLWDDPDPVNIDAQAKFQANYTEGNGSAVIDTNICSVNFYVQGGWVGGMWMSYNTTAWTYDYNRSFPTAEVVNWSVVCYKGNYTKQTNMSNITIIPANTAPDVDTPIIYPSSPQANDSMNCSVIPLDYENSTLYTNFTWYKNLVIDDTYNYLQTCTSGNICYTGILVPDSAIAAGENWTCAVKAWDDIPPEGLNSTWKNNSVIVKNITTNNLTLWDDPDPVNISQQAKFQANYTEGNGSAVIDTNICSVNFYVQGGWVGGMWMSYNTTAWTYDYNRSFPTAEVVNWSVVCYKGNYTKQTNKSNITVVGVGGLNVTLWNPENASMNVTQNYTFVVNASVVCLGGTCSNINATVWYNLTNNALPDTILNSTVGDKPFYNFSGGNVTKLCGTLSANEQCNVSWVVNATGYDWSSWYLNVTFNSSASTENSSSNFQINITILPPANTAPDVSVPSIIPSSPQANDSLNCTADPTDAENTTLYVNFTWYKNLVIDDTYNYLQTCTADGTCYTGILVPASAIAAGENWTCAVQVWDDVPPEGLNSTWKNNSVIVKNITTNNLTLWDDPDPVDISQQAKFQANYTEGNGSVVTDTNICNVNFYVQGGWVGGMWMSYNTTAWTYDYNRSFPAAEVVNWSVVCYKGNYTKQTNMSNITVKSAIPLVGMLNITLWYPPNASKNITQNETFLVNASVVCVGGTVCANVNATVWYNLTNNNYPDMILNSTIGDKPFYNFSGGNITKLCGNLSENEQCNVSWVVNATGYDWSSWYLNVTFNSSASTENSSSNFQINITIPPLANTPPYFPAAADPQIIPTIVYANDSMNCSAAPEDLENITLYVNFTWYKNLVIDDTYNYLQTCITDSACYTGILVPDSVIAAGENWTCAAQVWDDVPPEGLNSTWKNNSVIVKNITTNNLTLWDDPDPVVTDSQAKFQANYTEGNSSAVIDTNICGIDFHVDGDWVGAMWMTYNTTAWTYDYNRSFPAAEVVNWTVVCYKGNYTKQTNMSNITVTSAVNNPPLWRNQTQNNSNPGVGDMVELSAEGYDDIQLAWAILSTNETGTWNNYTVQKSTRLNYLDTTNNKAWWNDTGVETRPEDGIGTLFSVSGYTNISLTKDDKYRNNSVEGEVINRYAFHRFAFKINETQDGTNKSKINNISITWTGAGHADGADVVYMYSYDDKTGEWVIIASQPSATAPFTLVGGPNISKIWENINDTGQAVVKLYSPTTDGVGWIATDYIFFEYTFGQHYFSPLHGNESKVTWYNTSFIWQNSSVPTGTNVCWRIWYNDSIDQYNGTDEKCFTVAPVNETNLNIWDDPDPVKLNQQAKFLANYTNGTGDPVTSAICNISFNLSGSWTDPNSMSYNATSEFYEYNRSFGSTGTVNWKVNCSKSGFEAQDDSSTITVTYVSPATCHTFVNATAETFTNYTDYNLTIRSPYGEEILISYTRVCWAPYGNSS